MKCVILAGGSGTRLRPVSTQAYPKQFIALNGKESLIQKTAERLHGISSSGDSNDIFVSSNDQYKQLILDHLATVQESHIIVEPAKRNTAAAIFLVIKNLQDVHGCGDDEVVLFCPADHEITPSQAFISYCKQAKTLAENGNIVLFGIFPSYPETGYGYIHIEQTTLPQFYYPIKKFVEKPDKETAKKYVEAGTYFRNAGIFCATIGTRKEEFAKYSPELTEFFQQSYDQCVQNFSQVQDISIDYAIMEKTDKALVVPMYIHWSDVGSWDSVYDVSPKDEHGNVTVGDNVTMGDCVNSLVYASSQKKIVVDGIDNIIVVESEDGLYITEKGKSQGIKKFL